MLEAIEDKDRTPKTPALQPQSQLTFQAQSQTANEKVEIPVGTGAGAGSTSLTLLKQHIEIVNLNEEIQELRMRTKELETEMFSKNQEVYDV